VVGLGEAVGNALRASSKLRLLCIVEPSLNCFLVAEALLAEACMPSGSVADCRAAASFFQRDGLGVWLFNPSTDAPVLGRRMLYNSC
jgi:hypothetical protein